MPNTYTTLSSLFTAIANALRSLKGTSAPIVADNFPSEISGISPKAAQTYTPTTADQTIAAGQYLVGAQTVKGDANLVAENIKKDVTIFGVTGTYDGGGGGGVVYGFHVDSSESDPSNCVTYLEDAVGLTPAAMNFSTGVFSYGSWENAFFMPRPCMLKYDGTVDYYLDPNDFSKKTDGTASDIADASYDGNAMMEWPKIFLKIVADVGDNTSGTVYIADRKVDDGYHCFSNINNQGVEVEHFYTPIYNGSLDASGRLRSLSAKTYSALCQSKTAQEELDAALLNNAGDDVLWTTETLSDRLLITFLLILMGKSLDTQTVFGNDRQEQASAASSMLTTGTLNDKGLFFGYNDNTHQVKCFGMEAVWGNQWRRTLGMILANGTLKVKMTYLRQDGTTSDGYNFDGTGYRSVETVGGTSGAYLDQMIFDSDGMFPHHSGGDGASSSTYYCDMFWFATSGTTVALFGGRAYDAAGVPGAFCCGLRNTASVAVWSLGAAPSCKPLAT